MGNLRIRSSATAVRGGGAGMGTTVAGAPSYDDYLARLVKLVPAEIVGLFTVGKPFVDDGASLLVIWILICAGLCVLVRSRATSGSDAVTGAQWPAVVIATVSFFFWSYSSLQGSVLACPPSTTHCWYQPKLASLLVLLWTFVVPYIYKGD